MELTDKRISLISAGETSADRGEKFIVIAVANFNVEPITEAEELN